MRPTSGICHFFCHITAVLLSKSYACSLLAAMRLRLHIFALFLYLTEQVSFHARKSEDKLNCLDFSYFRHFSAILQLSCDKPVVSGEGTRSTRRKPPPNPKSLATLIHAPDGIRSRAVVLQLADSKYVMLRQRI